MHSIYPPRHAGKRTCQHPDHMIQERPQATEKTITQYFRDGELKYFKDENTTVIQNEFGETLINGRARIIDGLVEVDSRPYVVMRIESWYPSTPTRHKCHFFHAQFANEVEVNPWLAWGCGAYGLRVPSQMEWGGVTASGKVIVEPNGRDILSTYFVRGDLKDISHFTLKYYEQ